MEGFAGYLVDTNVISELGRVAPNERVLDWLEAHSPETKLSAITVQELYFGALRMPEGKRRDSLLTMTENLVWLYDRDVLPFGTAAAVICARLHRQALQAGHTPQIEDLMIGAICLEHHLCLVTRNVKDFAYLDIPTFNPFEEA